jgi:hypothetical protein
VRNECVRVRSRKKEKPPKAATLPRHHNYVQATRYKLTSRTARPHALLGSHASTATILILPPLPPLLLRLFCTYPLKPWPIRVFATDTPEYRAVPLHHSPCRSQHCANHKLSYVAVPFFFLLIACACISSLATRERFCHLRRVESSQAKAKPRAASSWNWTARLSTAQHGTALHQLS